jgi:hypothetical protein
MTRNLGALALGLCLAAPWGCDDDPVDPCADLDGVCDTEGTRRCTVAWDATVVCEVNADGCLLWVEAEACEAGCDDSGEEPLCLEPCVDECTLAEARCQGDLVQTCESQESGCAVWVDVTDCAAAGQVCDASGDAPICVDA